MTVAQPVRAPDCGSGGWGFKSPQSPSLGAISNQVEAIRGSERDVREGDGKVAVVDAALRCATADNFQLNADSRVRSVAQLVEHWSPKPAVGGSSPSRPAFLTSERNWSLAVPRLANAVRPGARWEERARSAARLHIGLVRAKRAPTPLAHACGVSQRRYRLGD